MIEKITTMVSQLIHSEQPYVLAINVLFLIALIVFILSVAKYWVDHKVVQKFVAKIKADAKEQERLREEEYQKQFEMEGRFESKDRMLRLNRKLVDSGLKEKFPELQPEIFLLFCVLTVGMIMVVFSLLDFPTMGVFILGLLVSLIIVFTLESMVSINTARIEKETVKFVNLLKNNSHMGGSIAEMLGRTIPYISGPLKMSVERCYYEIKSTGDTSMALQNLVDRTSYKKLKEVFDALRVCSTHNEDYEGVINEANVSIGQYISFRRETRQIKQSNLIEMIFMGAIGIFIVFEMRGMLPDVDVSYYMFRTTTGIVIIAGMVITLLYGIYKAIKNEE